MRAAMITPFVVAAAVVTASCGNDSPDTSTTSTTAGITTINSTPTTGANVAQIDLAHHTFPVSAQDALGTARKNFDGTVTKIELEREGVNAQNIYVYKVELMSDTEKYAAQVSADSGAIVAEKKEPLDADEQGTERTKEAVNLDSAVPLNQAMDTASKARPGRIEKWKIEGKNNTAQYEFDIESPGTNDEDYEVQVDAYSGQLKTAG